MAEEVRIAVACHKPYWMPPEELYVPVQAGAIGKPSISGFRRDDEGDGGISALNSHLSELTVLYWAWKNLEADAIGLAHYRRHFSGAGERGVLTEEEAQLLLEKAPVVVPAMRNYYIETLESHFGHTFSSCYMDMLMCAVAEFAPHSVPVLHRHLSSTKGHMFNMMIMRRDLLEAYCDWMFPIIERVESALEYEGLSAFDARMPGRLSEYLLDVWLQIEGVPYIECSVRNTEPVNWVKKGGSFLAAKFLGRKYVASF